MRWGNQSRVRRPYWLLGLLLARVVAVAVVDIVVLFCDVVAVIGEEGVGRLCWEVMDNRTQAV
jgi:hypothetical protein